MTIEELNGRTGLGVQAADGTMQGTLTSVHGACGVVKLTDGRVIWMPADKIVAWDKPAPAAEEARPAAEPEPVEGAQQERVQAQTDGRAAGAEADESTGQAPPAKALIPEKAVHVHVGSEGDVELTDEPGGVVAYDVTRFGWTVIYDERLRRVLWLVPSRESVVVDVDGSKVEVGLDSGELL